MRIILSLFVSIALISCFSTHSSPEVDSLNRRITDLELKVDSLVNVKSLSPGKSKITRSKSISYTQDQGSGRCQAITKKGTQCKRPAKNGDYCWQHGG